MSIRKEHLFTSLVKCGDCGWNMRYVKDRHIPKYICGNYSTFGVQSGCNRNPIKEEHLIWLIEQAYKVHNRELHLNTDFLKREIKQITIDSKQNVVIEFNIDLPNVVSNPNKISFVNEVQ